ncbi:MAG TPA: tyrosinase family protein, partial [Longimicrobiaceae bacterium]|nr:tyrosinase family protein [Longimicrobiaceae bacterium]
ALGGVGLLQGAHPGHALAAGAVQFRPNIYCLASGHPLLESYRTAVRVMRSRPPTDPTSWLAQANIHGAISPPPGMLVDECRHDATFFLSWHRMYLHFFERIVRQASGNPDFVLPYWGYSPTGRRTLPEPFRLPAAASNPLYTEHRFSLSNAGRNMQASALDPGMALAELAFGGFTRAIDDTPHGTVHGAVGGLGGWMAAFETAGRDPVFWLHHANIDRLWELWLLGGGGRANPTGDAAWMTTSFRFYDETGATVAMTGAQVVDTAAQLGYQYADTSCLAIRLQEFDWKTLTRIDPIDPALLQVFDPIRERPPLPDPPPLAVQEAVVLGAAPVELTLKLSPEAQRTLADFPTGAGKGNRLALLLEGIRLQSPPAVYYEVYLNLPAGAGDPEYTSPHYAGNLSFFGPSPQGPHGKMPLTRSIGLLTTFARLRAVQQWRDDAVRVTFVPRAFVEGEDPAKLLGGQVQATVGSVTLRIE